MRLLVLMGSPLHGGESHQTHSSSRRKLNQARKSWSDGPDEWVDGWGSYLKVGRGVAPRACPLRRHARRGALLLLGAVQDHEEILCSSPAGDQASSDLPWVPPDR